jgi:hypothetical protein
MTGREEIEEIAKEVVARLGGAVIPSVLPAYVGEAVRAAAPSQVHWMNNIPLRGPLCISTYWVLMPNGELHLELRDWQGQTFWRGTFVPEAAGG